MAAIVDSAFFSDLTDAAIELFDERFPQSDKAKNRKLEDKNSSWNARSALCSVSAVVQEEHGDLGSHPVIAVPSNVGIDMA